MRDKNQETTFAVVKPEFVELGTEIQPREKKILYKNRALNQPSTAIDPRGTRTIDGSDEKRPR